MERRETGGIERLDRQADTIDRHALTEFQIGKARLDGQVHGLVPEGDGPDSAQTLYDSREHAFSLSSRSGLSSRD